MPGASRPVGGPDLAQVRRVVSEIPGPRSRELLARQRGLVPAGVGAVLPVLVEAAGGGVIVDADGNSFIDFGSGIAVTTVGNSAPAVAERSAGARGYLRPAPPVIRGRSPDRRRSGKRSGRGHTSGRRAINRVGPWSVHGMSLRFADAMAPSPTTTAGSRQGGKI